MTNFEIGEMFWGKSLSYPWWPCVVVPNDRNEVYRNKKKIGIQYHVQLIGPDFDVCWIAENCLIKFFGKDHFEKFVEDRLSSDLPIQEKLRFDMRMSTSVQLMWMQACIEADKIYQINATGRLSHLPPNPNVAPTLPKLVPNAAPILPKLAPNAAPILPKLAPNNAVHKKSFYESIPVPTIRAKDLETMNNAEKRNAPKRSLTRVKYVDDESEADTGNEDDRTPNVTPKKRLLKKYNVSENGNKSDIVTPNQEQLKIKKKPGRKSSAKESEKGDEFVAEKKGGVTKEYFNRSEICLSSNIEARCFRAYMAQEMHYRIRSSTEPLNSTILAEILKEQWAALDTDTKLLYLNDEVSYLGESKSKVSGRQIKIPSRLRRTEDIAKIKRSSVKKCQSLQPVKKTEPLGSLSGISVKIEDTKVPVSITPVMSTNQPKLQEYKDVMDPSLWTSLSYKDCSTEMLRIIVSKNALDSHKMCHHCFKLVREEEDVVNCKGTCRSLYHLSCATNNKILLSEDNHECTNCTQKLDVCCICKNSKYMKKRSLVKCQKKDCPYHFHVACADFLTLAENNSEANELTLCPNHSCLTCLREDNNHACARLGALVSCVKCPISYHNNFLCIPAGCRVLDSNKIICYRHFDNNLPPNTSQQLLRCFVCFNDNATLKCSRCRAVFHPMCMSMPTYTDLLRDYVCDDCKLDRPTFHGQVVWIETEHKWSPAEIISPANMSEKCEQSLIVRDLVSHEFRFPKRCELVSFATGLSILKNVINFSDAVMERVEKMALLYWNWRQRLRPMTSEKFPLLGQYDLLRNSVFEYRSLSAPTIEIYEQIDRNIVTEDVLALVAQMPSDKCNCAPQNETCHDDQCSNFVNDLNFVRPNVIIDGISCRGVRVNSFVNENRLIGEVTGTLIPLTEVYKEMHQRKLLDSTSYIFRLSEEVFLTCEQWGNEWRHLNHSCQPNARLVTRHTGGSLRLYVLTLKEIDNQEITIDYRNSGLVLKFGFFCQCQTTSCSKVIGPTSVFTTKTDLITPLCCVDSCVHQSAPSVNVSEIVTEDNSLVDDSAIEKTYCFKCGTHGEFVTCDKADCKRQYHMVCVESLNRPMGIWLCPMHFCSQCSETATRFCGHCPMSSCRKHTKWHESHSCRFKDNGHCENDVVVVKEEMEAEEVGQCGAEFTFSDDNDFEDVPIIVNEFRVKKTRVEDNNIVEEDEENKKSVNGNEELEEMMENVVDGEYESQKDEKSREAMLMMESCVEDAPSSSDIDSDYERCDFNPCRIDESLDAITSPCIVDE